MGSQARRVMKVFHKHRWLAQAPASYHVPDASPNQSIKMKCSLCGKVKFVEVDLSA